MAATHPSCKAKINFCFVTLVKFSAEFVDEKIMDMSKLME